jgi:DNA polymerase-3 subunit chi
VLEKVVASGQRAVVVAGSNERVESLNAALWTYDDRSFLPHGSAADGSAALQPIWLTTIEENPNRAEMLVVVDGVVPTRLEDWPGICAFFDGRDDEAVTAARISWKQWKEAGHTLRYFRQTDRGGWETTS